MASFCSAVRALRVSIAIAVGVLAVAPAVALAAATLRAPSTARVGSRIAVSASGLTPGRYALVLYVTTLAPPGVPPTGCDAKVGAAATAVGGRVKISGKLPTRLGCRQGVGRLESYLKVRPGRYWLDLGGHAQPGAFAPGQGFVRRRIRLTP
jgi:hypothetical protein